MRLAGLVAVALRARRVPWQRGLGLPLAAGLLGLALAAPVWIPFLSWPEAASEPMSRPDAGQRWQPWT